MLDVASMPHAVIQRPKSLWESLRAQPVRCVSVMGMRKNTGKTVCLNYLLAQAKRSHVAVGITSIGRDGEERDAVFSIPKPAVRVTEGCLVATASDSLLRSKARYKKLGGTGIASPLGEILIVKVLSDGDMEVAGASRGHEQLTVIACLKRLGAELVFLDGALGRSQHASPAISDGVVLSTGAVVGGSMHDVLRKTRERLQLLSIARVPPDLQERTAATFSNAAVGVWNAQGQALFEAPIATLNAASVLLSLEQQMGWHTVAVSGAVGRSLWSAMTQQLKKNPGMNLVVADGTKLFVERNDVSDFVQRGGRLWAMREIRVLGITLNPYSPHDSGFEASAFLSAARQALSEHVVTDVWLEPTLLPSGFDSV